MNRCRLIICPCIVILFACFFVINSEAPLTGNMPLSLATYAGIPVNLKSLYSRFAPQASKQYCAKGVDSKQTPEQEGAADQVFDDLMDRFATTKSIGIFTKLSIKHNVDRLNQSFASYHDGERPPTIDELRERYDLMVKEMMVLVQKKDPELAREISAARLLLWSYLSDPEKYKSI